MASEGTELVPVSESGIVSRQEFGATEVIRQAETAMGAMAAQHKAMVEARFIVAMRQGRNWLQVRKEINELCADPGFAAEALYVKPLTKTPGDWNQIDKRERLRRRLNNEVGDWPLGFSARFVEAALFICGHFETDATILWEDEEKRITQVTVTDLVKNSSRGRTVVTTKTVERRSPQKGEEPLSTRYNSNGQLIYVYPANPDQVIQMEASVVSKSARTLGEALLPPHFKREWRERIEKTILDQAAKDPKAELKRLLDSFSEQGVTPENIETYVEHPLDALQPAELVALRKIYVAIANGECAWKHVMESKFGPQEGREESEGAKKIKERLAKKSEAASTAAPAAAANPSPAPPTKEQIEKGLDNALEHNRTTAEPVPEVDELPDPLSTKRPLLYHQGILYEKNDPEKPTAWRPMNPQPAPAQKVSEQPKTEQATQQTQPQPQARTRRGRGADAFDFGGNK